MNILRPGPGVGGHCIAVDPWFIVDRSPSHSNLIRTAREVNDSKPGWIIQRVRKCAEKFKNPVIACLGLSFKADVDDLRESPALEIVNHLKSQDIGELLVCEPNLEEHNEYKLVNLNKAISDADIILLLVDHRQFKSLNVNELAEKVVIDTRGVLRFSFEPL